VLVGNRTLMAGEHIELGSLAQARDGFAAAGRTAVFVAVDGRAVGVIAMADAARETAAQAVAALHEAGVQVVMLTGDNQATADRIAGQLGIDRVIAEVLPGDKAALAQADLGIAIGAGSDVAIETADVVLMRSDPLDVPVALRIGEGTVRKMRQNLGWAIGYNALALPIAAGVFEPSIGLVLRPEIAALSMSGSSLIVAVNALLLLPHAGDDGGAAHASAHPRHPRARWAVTGRHGPRAAAATTAGPTPCGRCGSLRRGDPSPQPPLTLASSGTLASVWVVIAMMPLSILRRTVLSGSAADTLRARDVRRGRSEGQPVPLLPAS
jgi:hypothetical protein